MITRDGAIVCETEKALSSEQTSAAESKDAIRGQLDGALELDQCL